MPRLYYFCLASVLLIFSGTMTLYFFYTKPDNKSPVFISKTSYEWTNVDGPIQPIPHSVQVDHQWANLGKALFNSKLLSGDGSVSCASCHLIDFGGDDGFPVSTGIDNQTGSRNSPTVLNAVFNFRQFWDGRSESLAEQVAGPIHNPVEMNTNWLDVIARLEQDSGFNDAFKQLDPMGVTIDNIVRAISTYEETLITPNAPIDQFLLGKKDALSPQQQVGFQKFQDYGCITCHQGRNIGGNLFQKIGRLEQVPAMLKDDLGRYTLTQNEHERHVFKVPSLRNVADTAPYFHNGAVDNLHDAVKIMAQSQLAITLTDKDAEDLVAFLKSLSAPVFRFESVRND